MSTLPNFEDDLFISYAHIDNQPLADGLKGWVKTFHERLKIRLEQLTGEPARIWRDRKLQGNDIFAETLVARLSKAAILVVVLSPRYVKSEWCLKELDEFCKRAETGGGLVVGDKSRVFKVVKFHVPLQEHPPQLRGSLGYEFFEYDAERGRAREFSPDVTPARDIRYWEKLDDIAYDIKQMLDTLDERQRQFVNHFRLGLNEHRQIEVLQTSLEELKKHIEERVADGRKPAPADAAAGRDDGPSSVYLICDREDLGEITPLEDYLFGCGFNVFLPAMEGDDSSLRED